MGVLADVEGTGDALASAVFHDRLGGGGNVVLVERGVETRATVTGGAEADLLVRIARIGYQVVVGADQGIDVDEVLGQCNLPREEKETGFCQPLLACAWPL